jgi:cysteine dioxygenase
VLVGNFVETQFELAPNRMVYAISSSMVGEGGVTVSTDSDIHQISNLQSESRDLITLHIYSPPLLTMNVYSLYDDVVRSYDDPINEEFFDGAGI